MGYHCALARLSGRPVVLNVDGLDWTRGKWGPIGRAYFYSAARTAVRVCTALVTDAVAMQRHYREHFGRDSTMIAYGADVEPSSRPELIAPFGVAPRGYYLIVSRLIPENSLEIMLEGFHRSTTTRSLLVVGGANYEDAFHSRLRALADSDARIRLVGQLHDQAALAELWCNSFAYLHGHSVGGTNPALLRAMGHGCCVLARNTVFNREVLAEAGRFFEATPESVTTGIDAIDGDPEGAAALGARAAARVAESYTWDGVTDAYERLFQRVASAAQPAAERGTSRSMG
jgi:glycosyltransferase involved in cell wall biosynthesis